MCVDPRVAHICVCARVSVLRITPSQIRSIGSSLCISPVGLWKQCLGSSLCTLSVGYWRQCLGSSLCTLSVGYWRQCLGSSLCILSVGLWRQCFGARPNCIQSQL